MRLSPRYAVASAALAAVAGLILLVSLQGSHRVSLEITARQHMIVTADVNASLAGRQMLRRGGSAVDAAVAALLVLTLVEPQSSGIGGGLYMLVRDRGGSMRGYDGREVAPASARPDMFLDSSGRLRSDEDIATGGLPVGVPGAVAALSDAHRRYGKLPWPELFEPAIALADRGFPVSRQLADDIRSLDRARLPRDVQQVYFSPDGAPRRQGETIVDRQYAATLRRIAQLGPPGFYEGPVAEAIVTAVKNARNPGRMTLGDLKSYRAREVAPLCKTYRQYRACSLPPSTSGGLTALQMLGMMARFSSRDLQPGTISQAHLMTQVGRLAYADRSQWQADPTFFPVPVEGLLDSRYLQTRGAQISPYWDMDSAKAGSPPGAPRGHSPQRSPARRGTSHMVVIDAQGLAVSMTSSIQTGFGAQIRAAGFLLNNELTDFSLEPIVTGHPVANAPAAGKRPLSSMGPFMLMKADGSLFAVLGSPGGSDIITYNVQALSALIDGREGIGRAVSFPHVVNTNGATFLEAKLSSLWPAIALTARGHRVRFRDLRSGLNGIMVRNGVLAGAADPRGVGAALGD